MATLQQRVPNSQRHRQQNQQQQQQQQQHQHQQCHNAADITRARITTPQGSYHHLLPHQHQIQEQTNLKQRTHKLAVNVGGGAGGTTADVLSHSQEHQRVNHRNEYTTTATRSAQTTSQQYKQKQKQRQRRHIDSWSSSLGARDSRDSEAKTHPISSSSGRLNWSCNAFNWRLDSTLCIMLTMFVVVAVVISGNAALAAQRDSLRVKDTKGLSNNANVIPNGAGSLSTGNAGNENGNAVNSNGADTNTISSGNAVGSHNGIASAPAGTTTSTTSFMNQNQSQMQNQNQYQNQTQATIAATTVTTTTTSTGATSKLGSSSMGSSGSGSGNAIASGSLQKANSLAGNAQSGNTGIHRNAIETLDDSRTGPYFDKAASKNVTALLGKTAYLNCRVKNLGNKTMLLQVSWVRHRDIHLLTVGRYTYTSDQRFRAIHQPQTEDWILQIKYPQHRDSGIYECQVSTTPHMSHYIHLNVVEPSTEIIGAPDLYIESGSTINLTCVILNSPEPPAYIFWNHNNAIINYDSPRGGVSVVTNKGETTTSFLLIKSARPTDSGLYQCNPSNAKPKSVTVHVLNGEFPAAMQRAGQAHHRMSPSHYLLVYLSLYLFTLAYVRRFMKLSPQSPQSQPPTSPSPLSTKIDGTPPPPQSPYKKESSQAVHCLLV